MSLKGSPVSSTSCVTCGKQWQREQGTIEKVLPRPKDTPQWAAPVELLSCKQLNKAGGPPKTNPRYKIKNKQQAGRQVNSAYLHIQLKPSLPDSRLLHATSMFHMQLVQSKNKKKGEENKELPTAATGNWLTLKGSTSQDRKLLFLCLLLIIVLVLLLCGIVVAVIAVTIAAVRD